MEPAKLVGVQYATMEEWVEKQLHKESRGWAKAEPLLSSVWVWCWK